MSCRLDVLDERLAVVNGTRCDKACPHLYCVERRPICLAAGEYLRIQGGEEKGPMRCPLCRACERLWGAEP